MDNTVSTIVKTINLFFGDPSLHKSSEIFLSNIDKSFNKKRDLSVSLKSLQEAKSFITLFLTDDNYKNTRKCFITLLFTDFEDIREFLNFVYKSKYNRLLKVNTTMGIEQDSIYSDEELNQLSEICEQKPTSEDLLDEINVEGLNLDEKSILLEDLLIEEINSVDDVVAVLGNNYEDIPMSITTKIEEIYGAYLDLKYKKISKYITELEKQNNK